MTENEHFGLVYAKTGSIKSGTVVLRLAFVSYTGHTEDLNDLLL
jgi:hypothetical protein